MQFHLNGFRRGDPTIADAESAVTAAGPDRPLPPSVDVLIVGCGPTGLTLAAQLAAFPEISVCIVDAKPGPLTLGQADGIASYRFSPEVLPDAGSALREIVEERLG